MDPILQNLIRYQELSLELSRIKGRLDEFPRQIAAIDAELEAATGSLSAAKAAVSDRAKEKRRLESEVQDHETKLKKYNDQLMQVKKNEEYKAMQHEIAGVKEKIGAIEEKILQIMVAADEDDHRVKDEEKFLLVRRREADERKGVVTREQEVIEAERARIDALRNEARSALSNDVLEMFDRLAGGRGGMALARARDERCQGCNVRIIPQVYQQIRRNDQIIQCDSCKRILYYAPDPTAPQADADASAS